LKAAAAVGATPAAGHEHAFSIGSGAFETLAISGRLWYGKFKPPLSEVAASVP
jgi:hypothetical protein